MRDAASRARPNLTGNTPLFEVQIWIDVECTGEETDVVCTLFAAHPLPIRPLAGESLSYFQAKDSNYCFALWTSIDPMVHHSVRVTIEDVSHYAVRTEEGVMYQTSVRCEPIRVPSLEDARIVCAFLTEQLGFSFDPYALNRLTDEA